MARINYEKVQSEIHDYCESAYVNTYDEQGILDEIIDLFSNGTDDINSIDDIDTKTWENLVIKHDHAE